MIKRWRLLPGISVCVCVFWIASSEQPIDEGRLGLGPFCIWLISVTFFGNGIVRTHTSNLLKKQNKRMTHRWRNRLKTQKPRVLIPFVPWLVMWHWASRLITWWLHFLVHKMRYDSTNLSCKIVNKISMYVYFSHMLLPVLPGLGQVAKRKGYLLLLHLYQIH